MPWILLLIAALLSTPLQVVSIPGVTPMSTGNHSDKNTAPDIGQEKTAYAALADVLEYEGEPKALIEQR